MWNTIMIFALYCGTSSGVSLDCIVPGRRFEYFVGSAVTQNEAFDECTAKGGKLAHVETAAIFDAVSAAFSASGYLDQCWVGMKKTAGSYTTGEWFDSRTDTSGVPVMSQFPEMGSYFASTGSTKFHMFIHPRYSRFDDMYDYSVYPCYLCEFDVCSQNAGGTNYGCLDSGRRFEMFSGTKIQDEAFDECNAKGGKLAHINNLAVFTAVDNALVSSSCWVGGKKTGSDLESTHFYVSRTDTNGVPLSSEISGSRIGLESGATYPRVYFQSGSTRMNDLGETSTRTCYLCEFSACPTALQTVATTQVPLCEDSSFCTQNTGGTNFGCLDVGRRFEKFSSSMIQDAAFDSCNAKGGKLAHVNNLNMFNALVNALGSTQCWVGGKKTGSYLESIYFYESRTDQVGVPLSSEISGSLLGAESGASYSRIFMEPSRPRMNDNTDTSSVGCYLCEFKKECIAALETTTTSTAITTVPTSIPVCENPNFCSESKGGTNYGCLDSGRRFEMFSGSKIQDDAFDECNAKGGKLAHINNLAVFTAVHGALGSYTCWVGGKKTGSNLDTMHFYVSRTDTNGIPLSSEISGSRIGLESGATHPRIFFDTPSTRLNDLGETSTRTCYLCEFSGCPTEIQAVTTTTQVSECEESNFCSKNKGGTNLDCLAEGRRFEKFVSTGTQDDAFDACIAVGGKLAHVSSSAVLLALDAKLDIHGTNCWIGAKKTGTSLDTMHFYDSKDDPVGIPLADDITASQLGHDNGISYPRIFMQNNGMNDLSSTGTRTCYICEFQGCTKSTTQKSPTSAFTTDNCSPIMCDESKGGTNLGCPVSGRRFEYFGIATNQANAWDHCEEKGGKLAHLDTEAIYTSVRDTMTAKSVGQTVWLGAKRTDETWSSLAWYDSKESASGVPVSINFPGYTSYLQGLNAGSYALYFYPTGDYMNDVSETGTARILCEFPMCQDVTTPPVSAALTTTLPETFNHSTSAFFNESTPPSSSATRTDISNSTTQTSSSSALTSDSCSLIVCSESKGGTNLGCPVPGRRFEYFGIATNQANAWDHCEEKGGKLAHLETEAIYTSVRDTMTAKSVGQTVWLGAKRTDETWGSLAWYDSKEAASGVPVSINFPSYTSFLQDLNVGRHALYFYPSGDYMNDVRETGTARILCEFPMCQDVTTPPVSAALTTTLPETFNHSTSAFFNESTPPSSSATRTDISNSTTQTSSSSALTTDSCSPVVCSESKGGTNLGCPVAGRRFEYFGITTNQANAWDHCEEKGGKLAHLDTEAIYTSIRDTMVAKSVGQTVWLGAKRTDETWSTLAWYDSKEAASGVPVSINFPGYTSYLHILNTGKHALYFYPTGDYMNDILETGNARILCEFPMCQNETTSSPTVSDASTMTSPTTFSQSLSALFTQSTFSSLTMTNQSTTDSSPTEISRVDSTSSAFYSQSTITPSRNITQSDTSSTHFINQSSTVSSQLPDNSTTSPPSDSSTAQKDSTTSPLCIVEPCSDQQSTEASTTASPGASSASTLDSSAAMNSSTEITTTMATPSESTAYTEETTDVTTTIQGTSTEISTSPTPTRSSSFETTVSTSPSSSISTEASTITSSFTTSRQESSPTTSSETTTSQATSESTSHMHSTSLFDSTTINMMGNTTTTQSSIVTTSGDATTLTTTAETSLKGTTEEAFTSSIAAETTSGTTDASLSPSGSHGQTTTSETSTPAETSEHSFTTTSYFSPTTEDTTTGPDAPSSSVTPTSESSTSETMTTDTQEKSTSTSTEGETTTEELTTFEGETSTTVDTTRQDNTSNQEKTTASDDFSDTTSYQDELTSIQSTTQETTSTGTASSESETTEQTTSSDSISTEEIFSTSSSETPTLSSQSNLASESTSASTWIQSTEVTSSTPLEDVSTTPDYSTSLEPSSSDSETPTFTNAFSSETTNADSTAVDISSTTSLHSQTTEYTETTGTGTSPTATENFPTTEDWFTTTISFEATSSEESTELTSKSDSTTVTEEYESTASSSANADTTTVTDEPDTISTTSTIVDDSSTSTVESSSSTGSTSRYKTTAVTRKSTFVSTTVSSDGTTAITEERSTTRKDEPLTDSDSTHITQIDTSSATTIGTSITASFSEADEETTKISTNKGSSTTPSTTFYPTQTTTVTELTTEALTSMISEETTTEITDKLDSSTTVSNDEYNTTYLSSTLTASNQPSESTESTDTTYQTNSAEEMSTSTAPTTALSSEKLYSSSESSSYATDDQTSTNATTMLPSSQETSQLTSIVMTETESTQDISTSTQEDSKTSSTGSVSTKSPWLDVDSSTSDHELSSSTSSTKSSTMTESPTTRSLQDQTTTASVKTTSTLDSSTTVQPTTSTSAKTTKIYESTTVTRPSTPKPLPTFPQEPEPYRPPEVTDCWGEWGPWGGCSVSCDTMHVSGTRQRTRGGIGGRRCRTGRGTDYRNCWVPGSNNCPVDCTWTKWRQWSSCDAPCGEGNRIRKRKIGVAPKHGGKNCTGSREETEACVAIIAVCPKPGEKPKLPPVIEETFTEAGVDEAVLGDAVALSATVTTSMAFMVDAVPDSLKSKIGHDAVETIPVCTYDGVSCDTKNDFITRQDSSLGNCFTFNHYDPPKHFAKRAGEAFGLSILLKSDQSDYLCTTQVAGFRVLIHNFTEYPFPDSMGYYVAPGTMNSISISQRYIKRSAPPYGDCMQEEAKTGYYFTGAYTIEGCFRSCFQRLMIEHCECGDPRLPMPPDSDAPMCGLDKKDCLEFYRECSSDLITQSCNCPSPCEESIFDATISTSALQTQDLVRKSCLESGEFDECMKNSKRNFATLRIFYDRMNSRFFVETPVYETMNLLSNLGGIMGIMLGSSVVTLWEMIFLVLDLLIYVGTAGDVSDLIT